MGLKLEQSWKQLLSNEFEKDYFQELTKFIRSEYKTKTVYPPGKLIFNALDSLPVPKVKVVILGQDPYHGPGQAHGLSFSVPDDINPPPSLKNIYKELSDDLHVPMKTSGNLISWVNQGVLLLNATLTVVANSAGSHQNKGWETFTDTVIERLADSQENLVFILWGNYAKQKGRFLDTTKHMVLTAPHPSPFSANNGFFGSKPFSKTNKYLASKGITPINW